MEEQIDLRPYIAALAQRWRTIALVVVLAGISAAIVALFRPPSFTASGDVLILPSRSQLAFDDRFVTTNTTLGTDINSRRQALIALATSPSIEERVSDKLPAQLAQSYQPGTLAHSLRVSADGDLLHIAVSGADAQSAQQLADAWAQGYVQTVNDLYGKNTNMISQLEKQQAEAQQRYDDVERELETFLSSSTLVRVGEQISMTVELLDEARLGTQKLYEQYLAQARGLEATLHDAETLRQQVADGRTDDLASSLAALVLRARTTGETQLPIDLQFDSPGELAQQSRVTPADLEALIAVLRVRRDALMAHSQQLAQSVGDGTGGGGLSAELREAYAQRLSTLYSQYEQQKARINLLQQRRDVAADALIILQRKLDEQRVASGAPEIQVRFISTSLAPARSALARAVLYAAAAAAAALLLGALIVIGQIIVRSDASSTAPPPRGERPLDQPTPS